MEFWEFLLQKEGDRSWLPLESPDVEILEGRYRVVARSSRVHTPVEIRITHTTTADESPKRRTQKRGSHTNQDGLMVVIPFTRLQPGIWELRCHSDLMADMVGESWQHAVQLQVLGHESELSDDWDPDWQEGPEQHASISRIPSRSDQQNQPLEATAETVSHPSDSIETAVESMETGQALESIVSSAMPLVADEMAVDAEVEWASVTSTIMEPDAIAPDDLASDNLAPDVIASDETLNLPFSQPVATLFQQASVMSEQLLDEMFDELDQVMVSPSHHEAVIPSEMAVEPALATESPHLQIQLDQHAYNAQRGQSLVLRGRVAAMDGQAVTIQPLEVTLRFCLNDPQTSQIWLEAPQLIEISALPAALSCRVTIPTEGQTRLILGEITLSAAGVPAESASLVLASQTFSITIGLDELLEAIANDDPSLMTTSVAALPTFASPESDLNLAFLDLINAPHSTLQFQPSTQRPLPPQIHQPDPAKPKPRSLDLPPFAKPVSLMQTLPNPEAWLSYDAIASSPAPDRADDPETAELPPSDAVPLPPLADHEPAPVVDATVIDPVDEVPASVPAPVESYLPPAPEDTAFRALNLQNRFWSRLNALVGDKHLSTWLRVADASGDPAVLREAVSELVDDLSHYEIVVDDDAPSLPIPPTQRRNNTAELPRSFVLPKDESVPLPQLVVPATELISGKSIVVAVKLPDMQPKIYVKLWIHDRQSRALLDGPRWLMDFIPTGLGELEARTQVTVPFGCVEVLFEAIAVEMATQRESHKVSVDRYVMPPDLPEFSLDELNI